LYHGSENPLIYRNTYEIELHCEFDLYNYPFDSQHWKIEVKGKVPMKIYPNYQGMDYNDFTLYKQYNNLFVFFVDYKNGKVYGNTIINLEKIALELFNDSTKVNIFKLVTFPIDKMKHMFNLTQEQIEKLKILESEKDKKDYSLISCII